MGLLNTVISSALDYFTSGKEGSSVTALSQKIKKAYGTSFDIQGMFKIEAMNLNNKLGNSFLNNLQSDNFGASVTGSVDGEMNSVLNSVAGKINGGLKSAAASVGRVFDQVKASADKVLGAVGLSTDSLIDSAKNLIGSHVNPVIGIDNFDMFVKSVSINEISFSDLREWIGQGWVNSTGRHELQQVTITLRDSNGGALYAKFFGLLAVLKDSYPNDQLWTIKIRKRMMQEYRNFINPSVTSKAYAAGNYVVNTKHAVLRSLGTLELDQDNSEFSTFTITFDVDPFPNN